MTCRIVGRALFATALACASATSLAQPPQLNPSNSNTDNASTRRISLADALSQTLDKNPALSVFPHRLSAADASALQANIRPSPTLSLEAENIAGDSPYNGIQGAQYTLALSQLIELGGKREQRTNVAALALDTEKVAYQQARLDVLGEAMRRYIELAKAHAQVSLNARSFALAEQSEAAAQRRVKAGAAPQSDLTRLTIAKQRAALNIRRATSRQRSASQRLAALWGDVSSDNLTPTSALKPLPVLPKLKDITARLEQSPTLTALATQQRLREAQVRLAEANGRSDVSVTAGARYDELSDANTLVLGFSMPLNIRNPNRGNEAHARASLEHAKAAQAAEKIELIALINELYRSLILTREELVLIDEQSLPLATQLYQDIASGYRAGRYSFLELINAQHEQLLLEQSSIELAAQFHQQRNELERITGLSFSNTAATAISTPVNLQENFQ